MGMSYRGVHGSKPGGILTFLALTIPLVWDVSKLLCASWSGCSHNLQSSLLLVYLLVLQRMKFWELHSQTLFWLRFWIWLTGSTCWTSESRSEVVIISLPPLSVPRAAKFPEAWEWFLWNPAPASWVLRGHRDGGSFQILAFWIPVMSENSWTETCGGSLLWYSRSFLEA